LSPLTDALTRIGWSPNWWNGCATGRTVNSMTTTILRRGNLPGDLTSFVGRRNELATARRQLGEWRLVTLTGIGGVGKTRLAVHLAAQLDRAFADGVWLVDLAALSDPELVAQTVATTLGVRDDSTRWSALVLADYLAGRRLLLLVDNCEHLRDSCAALLETLLRHAPELRVLATSRQPLGVLGERVLPVPPLSVPDPEAPPTSPEALFQFDAVALFVDRAQAAEPSFTVTAENIAAVSRLVRRLDGIPLALELAAARTRLLSPAQIVDRLDDGTGLLTTMSRTAIPHQRSLKALIDWSFDLCSEDERALWARLSVFPGGFDLEAAEHVCSGGQLASDAVLDALAGLVDKSVLVAERQGPRVRYRLPQTLREYGRERLTVSGQELPLRRQHRDYYRQQAVAAWEEWFGPRQIHWTAWMQVEHLNVSAALEFCLSEPEGVEGGLEMLPALGLYWSVTGSLQEGRQFLQRALAVAADRCPGRADALWVAAWIASNQGDMAAAEEAGEESCRLAQTHGNVRALAHASVHLGLARMLGGDIDGAERLFHQALATVERANPAGIGALRLLAEVARRRGDVDEAEARLREVLAICKAQEETWMRASALWSLAVLAWEEGDLAEAMSLARESLGLRAIFPDKVGIAQCLEILAWVAADLGIHDRAATLLGAAEAVWKAVGASLFTHLVGYHENCDSTVRRALDKRAFSQLRRKGGEQSLADMVAYAMEQKDTITSVASADKVSLTPRELQIAELVSRGLTNREIAAATVIAQRTAEGHVEHILTKLGFTSRAQIAAWVTERRQGSSH
jgi:predicted ATPase/DNA-binding CsgD family transcriptional regulator